MVFLILILQILFFTPFHRAHKEFTHGNLFSPPDYNFSVDISTFMLYWGVIFVFGGILYFLFNDKKPKMTNLKDD